MKKKSLSVLRVVSCPLLAAALFFVFPDCAAANPGDPVPREVAASFRAAGLPVQTKSAAPVDFSLPLTNGRVQKLSELKGKVVFLNFWATWCGPCRSEMPSMETLYRRFKDSGLEILAVNCAEEAGDVKAFMENYKLSFPTALDESGAVSRQYGIRAIPATYILDREGGIILKVTGSLDWDTPKIVAAFEELLKTR
jgi:thiol-disulfide isomerase/thioredoxin